MTNNPNETPVDARRIISDSLTLSTLELMPAYELRRLETAIAAALTTTPATSEAQTAQSDPTVTVSASGVDPSLPTHCDHGVSLDDPCYVCRTSTPSVSAAIAELVTKWRERANAAEPEVNRTWDDFGAARINVTRQIADELDAALRALPPDARAVDGDKEAK